jgi:hypothetical protein
VTKQNKDAMIAAVVTWILSTTAMTLLWLNQHGKLSDASLGKTGVLFFPCLVAAVPGPFLLAIILKHHISLAINFGLMLNLFLYWLLFRGIVWAIYRWDRKGEDRV